MPDLCLARLGRQPHPAKGSTAPPPFSAFPNHDSPGWISAGRRSAERVGGLWSTGELIEQPRETGAGDPGGEPSQSGSGETEAFTAGQSRPVRATVGTG